MHVIELFFFIEITSVKSVKVGHVSHGILNKLWHSKNGLGLNL